MKNKVSIFGVMYNPTNYSEACNLIISNAKKNKSYTVSALAVHGLIESYNNKRLKLLVNSIDIVVPDGQPVKWAMNSFYKTNLKDRVYGPKLTIKVLERANELGLKLFLYGSTDNTINKFAKYINRKYQNIKLVGIQSDRFRDATPKEDVEDIEKINSSEAHIVLVGRGCPRQEIWVAEHKGKIDAAMLAVGAAFDFYAGTLKQAPKWMQKKGLEWLFRLLQEPKRLWKRYLKTNIKFIYLFIIYKFKYWR